MEKISIYKIKQKTLKAVIGIGVVFIFLGLTLLIRAIYVGFNTNFFGGNWNSVNFIAQGIIFTLLGLHGLKYRNYFIEWDENQIRYLIKGEKKIRIIEISKIVSIEIKLNKIICQLNEHKEKIELEFEAVEYSVLKRIKDKFEELKTNL